MQLCAHFWLLSLFVAIQAFTQIVADDDNFWVMWPDCHAQKLDIDQIATVDVIFQDTKR